MDKSGCISFGGKKYEVGVIYIGRTVDIVYDPADISILTVEDNRSDTSFRIKELVIGEYTGPRPRLPDFMTSDKPETSRLLDEKRKRYDKRQLSAKRAISYAQINVQGSSKADFGLCGKEEQPSARRSFSDDLCTKTSNEGELRRQGGDENV